MPKELIDRITNATEIVVLANEKKSVIIKEIGRVPAAFVQNWQLRYVCTLIAEGKIKKYTSKKNRTLFNKNK